MKKSIVAILISATLVISIIVAACGQPTAIAPGAVSKPPQTSPRPDYRPQEEKQLEEIRLQTVLAIELSPSASTSQRAGMYTALQQIEDAQQFLSGLDETRGMMAAVMVNQGASVNEIDAALRAIEDTRQAVLASVGLAY